MSSNESSGADASLDRAGRAKPGWLFVLPWSLRLVAGGGVNEVVKSLILQVRDDGVFSPQLLVSSEWPGPGATAGPEVILPHRLNLWSPIDHRHPVRGLISFLYRLPYRCSVGRRIIGQYNIKIINPHFPGLGCLVFVVLKKLNMFRGKIILSVHLSDIQDALATKGLERNLWKILLQGADRIVAVSEELAKDVLTLDSTVAAKLTTIYNGVDLATFAPVASKQNAQFQGSAQAKTILSIGAFMPRKGHDVLVRAFALVVNRIPDAHLILVGQDGPDINTIRDLIGKLSLEQKVSLHVDVPHENVPSFLAQAQLFVLASSREGHPLSVIEAGASGLPVVCTRSNASHELVADGVTGRLVEFGDERALSEAIIELLTHPEESQRLAKAFHEYVKNNLTWRHTYQDYLKLVRDEE